MLETVVKSGEPNYYRYSAYTEYIVEDPKQVCLKYLVQFTKAVAR